jgi:short subunit dehydrogenase-like uncharacterized protein
MPDVLLFGATGYTGRLTAHALAQRGADFAIAGRNQAKLEALAEAVGAPEVRFAEVGDVSTLTDALHDVKVLVTCVGPFVELGWAAVEAAVRARVHYVDSTGEGLFVQELIERFDAPARAAGVALAPAMAFDEIPADVAATMAAEGLDQPDVVVTYALPSHASLGTVRSSLGIMASRGPWIEDGRRVMVGAGERRRWAPMPPPLGPQHAVSFPFALGHLAPLHLPMRSLKLFTTTGSARRIALRAGVPVARALGRAPAGRRAMERLAGLLKRNEGPGHRQRARSRWTILAEARSGRDWANVALTGTDPYGLSAGLLASSALELAAPGYGRAGVVAPVQAVGLEWLEKQLTDNGVRITTYRPN